MRKRILVLLPFFILAVFLFFRIYHIDSRVGFGWDQERDARAAMDILSGNLTLIGPRVQGPMGFFLPPYFFYLIAPFYALTAGNPIATTIFIGFWSMLFVGVSYFVLSKIFSKKVALIFLALWAVNPLSVSIDTIAWNPIAIPLLAILLIYAVNRGSLFWSGLILGIGISFHMQFLFMSLALIPLLIEAFKNKKISGILKSAVGFIITFLPILIFDLRHNFLNIKLALEYLGSQANITRVLPVWDNIVAFSLGIAPNRVVSLAVYVLTALTLLVLVKKAKERSQKNTLTGFLLVWVFSLPLYFVVAKNPSEYYFNFLLVIPFIPVSYLLSGLLERKKELTIVLLGLLISVSVVKSKPLLNSAHFSLRDKANSVWFLGEATKNGEPFNVSFNVPANEDAGFRYLLDYYKVKYSGNPIDPLVEFVIPPNKKDTPFVFGDIGVYIPSGWIKDNWIR